MAFKWWPPPLVSSISTIFLVNFYSILRILALTYGVNFKLFLATKDEGRLLFEKPPKRFSDEGISIIYLCTAQLTRLNKSNKHRYVQFSKISFFDCFFQVSWLTFTKTTTFFSYLVPNESLK